MAISQSEWRFHIAPSDSELYTYRGVVERVIDGDSAVISIDLGCGTWLRGERCRLAGIDAPELRGPSRELGEQSRLHLIELLAPHAGELFIRTRKDNKGKWGRWLVDLWTSSGTCINEQMVLDGYAVPYEE